MSIGSVATLNGCKCCLFARVSGFMGRERVGMQEKEEKEKTEKKARKRRERENLLIPSHFTSPFQPSPLYVQPICTAAITLLADPQNDQPLDHHEDQDEAVARKKKQ